MLARYFMFSQVYFHPVRRIYDIHLKDFLIESLKDGKFPIDINQLLLITDNEITADLLAAERDQKKPGHSTARRIIRRRHFREFWKRNPRDFDINTEAGKYIFEAAKNEFGLNEFRHDYYPQKSGAPDFPVKIRDGRIASSLAFSKTLNALPVAIVDCVFCNPDILSKAETWLRQNLDQIIQLKGEEEGDE